MIGDDPDLARATVLIQDRLSHLVRIVQLGARASSEEQPDNPYTHASRHGWEAKAWQLGFDVMEQIMAEAIDTQEHPH